jgi:hypothetical protein
MIKLEFKQDFIKYLGFIIQAKKRVYINIKKVEAIRA